MSPEQSRLDVPANEKTPENRPVPALSAEAEEQKLRVEYDWLTDGLLHGLLTPSEKKRLHRVEARLDDLDALSPAAAAMHRKQDDIKQQLNALLEQAGQIPDA